MKQFFGAVTLFVAVAFSAFFYRNILEHRTTETPPAITACTLEAKLCPDGSSVGRTGPTCAFAACALPNIELPGTNVSFVLPNNFVLNPNAPQNGDSLIAAYEKNGTSTPSDAIVVRSYAIPEGKTADDVILSNTMYETSGMQPKSIKEFKSVVINGKTFSSLTVERFEAQVHTVYYLSRTNDVLRFEALDRAVTGWMEPGLVISSLPTHKALLQMLGTLQSD